MRRTNHASKRVSRRRSVSLVALVPPLLSSLLSLCPSRSAWSDPVPPPHDLLLLFLLLLFVLVSRYQCVSDLQDLSLLVDINSDLYPLSEKEKVVLALSYTLNRDGKPDEGHYGKETMNATGTLMDDYDYVMYGKIFRVKDAVGNKGQALAEVLVSFGGLILQLFGEPKQLQRLDLDKRVYLLIRKV